MIKMSLFNKCGDDSPANQSLIGGNPTGISNLNNNTFTWANNLYRTMTGNTWFPEKISLADDKVTITNLTDDENTAVKDTLSFLIFLDSFQCLNLPNIKGYITSPAVANLIGIQEYQEIIHSQSYQYLLEGLYPSTERDEIYDRWRTSPVLLSRIEKVAEVGEAFIKDPSLHNFKRVIIANFILESIFFYQGFNFFDQLASRNKLVQTDKMITYIRNDEITHIGIFVSIIRELFIEADYALAKEMIMDWVTGEIEWSHHIYGDRILGISKKSSEGYVKHLANDRWWILGRLDKLYPEVTKNPYEHLEVGTREGFFESKVTEYQRSETVMGWDDF